MQIIKRDGRVVEFNKERIINAITKAMMQTPEGIDLELANKIATSIEKQLENTDQVNVYEIQDLVEKKLMGSSRKEVAQSYITYRYNRDIARRSKTQEVFLDIISAKTNEFDKKTLNSNSDIPRIMMMKFASEVIKPYVDAFLLSPEVRKAEKDGYIYIYDKDYYPTKALNAFQHSFNITIENKASPQNIEQAIDCIYMPMVAIQKEISGGQAIPAFDYLFAPYVKKTFIEELKNQKDFGIDINNLIDYEPEEYTKKEIKNLEGNQKYLQIAINKTVDRVQQALKTYMHNMNIITPALEKPIAFNVINYGTDTSAEGRCIIRELLQLTFNGIQNDETPMFPIQVWKKKKGVNYERQDKNYDLYKLALKVTAKRFFPNYLNLDATFNETKKWKVEDSKRWYHECAVLGNRIRIFEDRYGEKTSIGKGNLASILIDLPRIAIEANIKTQEKLGLNFEIGLESKEQMTEKFKTSVVQIFKNDLENYLSIAAIQLYDRFKFQATATISQFPLLMSGNWVNSEKLKLYDIVEPVIKHGTLNIGFIGLAETLIVLRGEHHGESEDAQNLGIEIVTEMRELAEEFSEKYNLNFSIIATAEEEKRRFIRKDKLLYGDIKGVTDKEYYTNSSNIPRDYKCTKEEKAKIEAPYHDLCRAGHMLDIKLTKEELQDTKKVEEIVDLMDKYNMGYTSINHMKTKCLDCGNEDLEIEIIKCKRCGSKNVNVIQKLGDCLVSMPISEI